MDNLLRRLAATATLAIQNGIEIEWNKANDEADKLLQTCYGRMSKKDMKLKGWMDRNLKAMHDFMNNAQNGRLKLSDRIWKSTKQLREEMEIAITLGIGEGDSAASISKAVRKYLNDPDLMFRRFRYKDENGNWRYKWKKKVKDENGRTRWIDYDRDSYKTGQGNYKSSAKNAMRGGKN